MVGDLRGSETKRRWTRGCHAQKVNGSTISTNVVLVSTELTALCGDSLQVLLSRCVCITDLEEKTFLANGLTMKLLDDLLTDITRLKAVTGQGN